MSKPSITVSILLAGAALLHAAAGPAQAQAERGARAADVVTPQDEFRMRAETAAAQGLPFIENFQARPSPDLKPGSRLGFSLRGTPGAKVDVSIQGVRGVIELPEVRYGEYATTYTVRGGDRITERSEVNVTMRFKNKVATASLGQRLIGADSALTAVGGSGGSGGAGGGTVAGPAPAAGACPDCASVEAVNVVNLSGTATQAAQATQGGAWTPATGPGESYRYDVVLRYPDGRTVTMPFESDPGLAKGEQVRVNNGVLIRHGQP
jgi:hypothetical protein